MSEKPNNSITVEKMRKALKKALEEPPPQPFVVVWPNWLCEAWLKEHKTLPEYVIRYQTNELPTDGKN